MEKVLGKNSFSYTANDHLCKSLQRRSKIVENIFF